MPARFVGNCCCWKVGPGRLQILDAKEMDTILEAFKTYGKQPTKDKECEKKRGYEDEDEDEDEDD